MGTSRALDLSEASIQADIIVKTSHLVDWFRNNTGVAKFGGRWVAYGVGGVGGSDLIGIVRATGQFIACEVKSAKGKATKAQVEFLARIRLSRGIALVARSPEDVFAALERVPSREEKLRGMGFDDSGNVRRTSRIWR